MLGRCREPCSTFFCGLMTSADGAVRVQNRADDVSRTWQLTPGTAFRGLPHVPAMDFDHRAVHQGIYLAVVSD